MRLGVLWLSLMVVADARASVCSNFVSNNNVEPLACDGVGWVTEIWSTDAAQLDGYNSCNGGPFPASGPEWIFPFDCPGDVEVRVTLGGTDCDVDLFVLASGCNDIAGCVEASVTTGVGTGVQDEVTFTCTAGTSRYIVLEGYDLSVNPGRCLWDSARHNYRYTDVAVAAFCDELCGDGFDNDGDGRVDCGDVDCGCQEDCSTVGDEDGDLAADCADFDCLGAPECCDDDGDGYAAEVPAACGGDDCDDQDELRNPGANEVAANGQDEDCDGGDMCYVDADRDGYGTSATIPSVDLWCGNVAGESQYSNDCLDVGAGASSVRPGGREVAGDGIDQDCDGVDACWRDLDNDGYGTGGAVDAPGLDCAAAVGWATQAGDCQDSGANAVSANPGAAEICDGIDNDCDGLVDIADPDIPAQGTAWPDADGDGYGTGASLAIGQCGTLPAGYAPRSGDCDDRNPQRSPGAAEIPYDGLDQDCSGADWNDLDGDGAVARAAGGQDCDDSNPGVRPGQPEIPDGIDQDCSGVPDNGTARFDDDGDGVAEIGGDCDDTRALVRPGLMEICDGLDNDCDNTRDEGTECRDDDGDGFTELQGDCNDGDRRVNPAQNEADGNGRDDDCDGYTDGRAVDVDHDGFAASAGDCNDNDAAISPVAPDVPNGIDDDCNGRVDERTDRSDDDGDGFAEVTGDCFDGNPAVFPGAPEVAANGLDDDCDGRVDNAGDWGDGDGDGWTAGAGDCDDANRDIAPDEAEVADGVDQDCDGLVDEGVLDADGDGYSVEAGDCDDAQGWAHPDADEVCDKIDNDCDGQKDEGCVADTPEAKGGCSQVTGAPWLLAGALLAIRRRRGAADDGMWSSNPVR
jgi:hypothetical protein